MTQDDIFSAEPPPPRPGMSGGAKVAIGLGIGCGGLMLLACGGLVGLGLYVRGMADNTPAGIRARTDSIAQIDLPAGFEPENSLELQFPFKGKVMTWVTYTSEDPRGMLVLAQINGELFDEAQLRESLRGEQQSPDEVEVEESEEIERTIRGEKATFTLARGTSDEFDGPVWQLSGTFSGQEGPAFVLVVVDADKVSRDELIELIDSIE